MEHYPAPEGTDPIDVPYLGAQEYDGGEFTTYPRRRGWSECDLKGYQNFGNRSPEEVEEFFQTWLVFGFVIEVFGIVGIKLKPGDFIRTGQNGQPYVTTQVLPRMIKKWRDMDGVDENDKSQEARTRSEEAQRHALAMKPIITLTLEYAKRYCANENTDIHSFRPISPRVALSIIALGTAITTCATLVYSAPHFRRYLEPRWPTSAFLKERFVRADWCPKDISQILSGQDISGHYYFGSLPPPRKYQNHKDCTEGVCVAGNIDLKTYRTKHVNEECACKHWEADGIVQIIQNNNVPLVRWRKEHSELLEIFPNDLNNTTYYVAISHVYDSNGNISNQIDGPTDWDLIDNLDPNNSEKSVPFWMDTLCCPVKKEYEKQRHDTIAQMRNIYQSAHSVLALDLWMQELPRSSSLEDIAVRLYLSNWRRRLWTLQEGVLAQNLYIQFKDGPVPIEDIWNGIHYTDNLYRFYDTTLSRCFEEIAYPFYFMKPIEADPDPEITLALSLEPFVEEIQNRSISRRSDETICLATLLGFNPLPILNAPDEEKMETFLRLLAKFDRRIIFNTYPRLKTPGFRWAPKSFMDRSRSLLPSGQIPVDPNDTRIFGLAILQNEGGLVLTYPGIKLGYISPSCGTTIRVKFGDDSAFKIWLPQNEASQWLGWESSAIYAIVLYPYFRYASVDEATSAILGVVESEYDDILTLRHVSGLWVRLEKLDEFDLNKKTEQLTLETKPQDREAFDGQGLSYGECLNDEQVWRIV